MTNQVTYTRGDGDYVLTVAEIAELTDLRNILLGQVADVNTQSNPGLGLPIYTFLLELISEEVEVFDPETNLLIAKSPNPI